MPGDEQVVVGFAAQAVDAAGHGLDVLRRLMPHPEAVFFMRAVGDQLASCGVHHDDLLIVDRSREPKVGDVVVANVAGTLRLCPLPAHISPEAEFELWGTVAAAITEQPRQVR